MSHLALILSLVSQSSAGRADDAAKGKPLYAEHCSKCHGANGDGQGRAGRALDPKPTDFRNAKADDDRWFKITKVGSKALGKSNNMEGYGKLLTDEQIGQVLAYCKTFKREGRSNR